MSRRGLQPLGVVVPFFRMSKSFHLLFLRKQFTERIIHYPVYLVESEFGTTKASNLSNIILDRMLKSFGGAKTSVDVEINVYEDIVHVMGFRRHKKPIELSEELVGRISDRLQELVCFYLGREETLSENSPAKIFERVDEKLMRLDRLIGELVLPRVNQDGVKRLRNLLENNPRVDMGLFPLSTMMLYRNREDENSLVEFVRGIDLFDDERLGSKALIAIGRLSYVLRRKDALCVPLVDYLVSVIRHRTDITVISACHSLATYVRQHPSCKKQLAATDIWNLAKQTRPRSSTRFPEDDLVDYRKAAAYLA